MLTYNRINIFGIVGDVSFRQASNQQTIARVSVATHRKEKGEWVTDWFAVILFDPHESLQTVVPGDVFGCDGTLRIRPYKDKDQRERVSVEIIADRWTSTPKLRNADTIKPEATE